MKNAARILTVVMAMMPLLAMAQMGDGTKLTAKVPFEFMAGNKAVPAGECAVLQAGRGGTQVMIRNASAKISQLELITSTADQKGRGVNALVFHKYGDRYFLTGVELESTHAMYTLPATKLEKELRAQNGPATEEILLAALK
jgi:hypothetical protein